MPDKYDPRIHHRRSIRLRDYDYRQDGAYFVTLCIRDKECLLGTAIEGGLALTEWGQIVAECWEWLPQQYPYVEVDTYVVMPNHTHAVVLLTADDLASQDEMNQYPQDSRGRGGCDDAGDDGGCGDNTGGRGGYAIGRGDYAIGRGDYAIGRGDYAIGRGGSRTAPTGRETAPQGKRKPLGRLVGAFKTVSTKRINELRDTPGRRLWQRNYYEHIIRREEDLDRIREYIMNNPGQWAEDEENPEKVLAGRSIGMKCQRRQRRFQCPPHTSSHRLLEWSRN